MELDTLLTIASELGLVTNDAKQDIRQRTTECSKLINGLIHYQTRRGRGIEEDPSEYDPDDL